MLAGIVIAVALLPLAVWLVLAPLSDVLAWIMEYTAAPRLPPPPVSAPTRSCFWCPPMMRSC